VIHNIWYFDEVKKDIAQAKTWYKEQQEGLQIRFALEIKEAIINILKNPTIFYSIRYKNIRIAHPKIFPYNIHFYIDVSSSTVVITAIIHNKRDSIIAEKRI
jgi:hypothetical protein